MPLCAPSDLKSDGAHLDDVGTMLRRNEVMNALEDRLFITLWRNGPSLRQERDAMIPLRVKGNNNSIFIKPALRSDACFQNFQRSPSSIATAAKAASEYTTNSFAAAAAISPAAATTPAAAAITPASPTPKTVRLGVWRKRGV